MVVLTVFLWASQGIADNFENETVKSYLEKVADLDGVIDNVLNSGEVTGKSVKFLEATRNKLKALDVPIDARALHELLIGKYKPIIEMVSVIGEGIKEKNASRGEKSREMMEFRRREFESISARLVPILYQAEEAFDQLILRHNISPRSMDIDFHGLAVKKVNIHVTVLDSKGLPVQGALVSGSFFQDLVINGLKREAHKGRTDSKGYVLLSGREGLYVDVRVVIEGYKNNEKRVLVRDGLDKDIKILLDWKNK